MKREDKIYVAGHRGMVGSAISRKLRKEGFNNLLEKSKADLDLRDQSRVNHFFEANKPDIVIIAAAHVGGILANDKYPAEFLYDNIMMEANVIHAAHQHKVKKLLLLGSSCIYPKMAEQPIAESSLLSGYLEKTNEAYAIAKIAGIKLCQYYRKQYGCNFISAMPTNLYGIGDNYHPENSHVLPALIRKIDEAKRKEGPFIQIWGTGAPLREFMFADDLADACFFLMQHYNEAEIINVGSGEEISIMALAQLVCEVIGYKGLIQTDPSKPDGTPRKLMDSSRIRLLGFKSSTSLRQGIAVSYEDFVKHHRSKEIITMNS